MIPFNPRLARSLAIGTLALFSAACSDKLLGVAGSIVVTPMQLDFGQTTVATPATLQVTIQNQGSAALVIASINIASDPNSELSLSNLLTHDCNNSPRTASTSLSPGECASFSVTWTPTSNHLAAGAIEIDSSDALSPAITLPVSGSVTAVPGCSPACTSTQSCCNLTCVDNQTDPSHCGGCGACAQGQTCNGGLCITPAAPTGCDDLTAPCGGNQKCCNHACVTVGSSGVCPCAASGASNFGAGSIIIPMDECWQRGLDVTTLPSYCGANGKKTADDSPLKAYGLIFFLIRHNVTVYVAIDANKTSIDAVDMALVSLSDGPPVTRYNWSTGQAVPLTDTTQTTVQYRGGPFLIDSSQHDRVMQLLKNDPDFAQFRSAGTITVHVATVGFQSAVAKSIDVVPSRVALLAPAGGNTSYEQILINYLDSAGLNFSGASGTPSAPGAIYDVLQESDFLPDFASSNLKKNGYKLLWSPHWEGGTSNTPAQLATIGDYVNSGGDLFAECAAIGTLEGSAGSHSGSISGGSAATRFMTTAGVTINSLSPGLLTGTITGPFTFGGLGSPFAQRGDFPFAGFDGVIADFAPGTSNGSAYNPGVVRYVTGSYSGGKHSDLFTSIDQHAAGKGTVVYLSGHDYSYGGNTGIGSPPVGITAGSRLVLNTLFSLGTNNVCQP